MPKHEVISGPYFSVFSPNTGKYGLETNSVFGHLSRSATDVKRLSDRLYSVAKNATKMCMCERFHLC